MKQGLLIIGSKKYTGDHTFYDVKQNDSLVELFYSKVCSGWVHPGKLAYSLENTGNGYVFKSPYSKEEMTLDYSQAEALRSLLKLTDTSKATFKFIEQK